MNWQTKSLIQKSASRIPYGKELYYLGQRYGGRLKDFCIESRLDCAKSLLEHLHEVGDTVQGKEIVEFGTGWAPILPLIFWLYGAKGVETFDVAKWLHPNLVVESVKQWNDLYYLDNSVLAEWKKSVGEVETARQELFIQLSSTKKDSSEILRLCNISYHAPADPGNTGLSDSSKDLVFSNLVLELIPVPELHRIFEESFRILRPRGLMLHLIDTGDQFAAGDRSINSINFLQYSEKEFSKYNSAICFQNRLRPPTYLQIIKEHNFEILIYETQVDSRALRELPQMKIHSEFLNMTPEEICTKSVFVLAKKGTGQKFQEVSLTS